MTAPLTFRRLVPADVAPYRRLMLDAYEQHPDAFTSSVAERAALPMTWWQSRVGDDPQANEVVFGGFEASRLIGVAGLSFETREKARHKATLFGMYVPAAFRQRGVGRALVRAVLEHAASRRGVGIVQLTVTEGNVPARSLYEELGFVAFGIEPFAVAVGGSFVAKVHMWRRLDAFGDNT